jgi:hypothetical protein
MADAAIAAWNTKYTYNFWRPVAAIRESDPGTGPTGLGDGNPNTHGDVKWTPLGAPMDNGNPNGPYYTPPFPAYTSGHATIGAAMFRVVGDFYHTDHIAFSWMSDEYNGVTIDQYGNVRPAVTRHYASLSQASYENAESRIYLGIHWPWDRDQGMQQGTAIADYAIQHVLMPLNGRLAAVDPSLATGLPAVANPARPITVTTVAPATLVGSSSNHQVEFSNSTTPDQSVASKATTPAPAIRLVAADAVRARDWLFHSQEWWE